MIFNFNEYILNGFYKTSYDDIDSIPINNIPFDKVDDYGLSYPSSVSYTGQQAINKLKQNILVALEEVFSSVHFVPRASARLKQNPYGLWDGVEPSSSEWHNDHIEGGNMFALIYFDSMPTDGSYGGSLSVKSPANIITLYPQRGDIVFVSHADCIHHKAESSTIQRRVMNMAFLCQF